MKVILLKELKGHGGEGDVVDVRRGFANNYLLPQKYAVVATKGNLKQLEQRRANIEKREEVRVAEAEDYKAKLEGEHLVIKAKVGDEGVLFGSVTAAMIADAIKEDLGFEIDRRRVELGRPIKMVGTYDVEVALYREIKAALKVNVVDIAAPVEEPAEEVEEVEEPKEAASTDAE